jgi:hypothetical protein
VWLANTRGNKYSERHEFLDPDLHVDYWLNALTFDVANYDFPAFISFIKNTT